jgi:iron-sulfur cluster assembly protein
MTMHNILTLTDAAIKQLAKLCAEHHGKGLYINIKTSGCSGYRYDLSIITKPSAEDEIFMQANQFFVAINKNNIPIINGSLLDYVKEGVNARFKFNNPNEIGSCGCGESFTVNP